MAFFSEEIIEEIRLNNDIVEVVSEYVKIEKKGKYYFGLCPFHKEKTPSFTVTPSMQIFNCFGCSRGGNVIHFIMNVENLDFADAVRFLAERANIAIPEGNDEKERIQAAQKQEIININSRAARYFHELLVSSEGKEAMEYLRRREVSGATLRRFGLGYAADKYDDLYKYLRNSGYREDVIIASGLVIKSGGSSYDRFRNRLMFPIFDLRGNIIGFGGRAIDSSKPKYMNSPETLVYNKSSSLYGMNFAKKDNSGKIVLVEGYMDVISLHQNGIINSVASLGTALTESQARILRKYATEVYIAYDADAAGQKATMRGLEILNEAGCNVRVVELPGNNDPDDYVKKYGKGEFLNLLESSLSLVEYKVKMLKNEIDTSSIEGKVRFVKETANILSKIDSRVEIELFVKKIAGDYGISEESINAEIIKRKKPFIRYKGSGVSKAEPAGSRIKDADHYDRLLHDELMLLAVLSIDNNIYSSVKNIVSASDFYHEDIREIAGDVFNRIENDTRIVPAELMNLLDGEKAGIVSGIIERECIFDQDKQPVDVAKKIRKHTLNRKKDEILNKLKNKDSLSKGDVLKLTLELNNIITEIKKI